MIYPDAVGDTAGADATWGAHGIINFNGKLRKWLKPIVASDLGWGQLPAKDETLFITFVGGACYLVLLRLAMRETWLTLIEQVRNIRPSSKATSSTSTEG